MASRARALLRLWLAVAVAAGALALAVLFWPDPPGLLARRPSPGAPPTLPPAHAPPAPVRNPARHPVSRLSSPPPAPATSEPPDVLSGLEVTAALQRNAEETARTVEQLCARAEALKRSPASAPLLPPLPAMDASAVTELSQLTRAGRRYFWPGVSPEVTRRAFECSPLPCAQVLEGASARRALAPYSPAGGEAELWDLASMGGGCDGVLLRMLAGSAPASPSDALGLVQLLSAP